MRKYIYILFAAIAFWGCADDELDWTVEDMASSAGDGTVTMAFNLKLSSSTVTAVSTRSTNDAIGWSEKENVTEIVGWAFVFATDEDGDISGDSRLLQKVAFKTTEDSDGNDIVYVVLDEYDSPCYIRLLTSMTTHTTTQISSFVSLKMYNADEDGSLYGFDEDEITTYNEYKHIDATLQGYYNYDYDTYYGVDDANNASPDPTALTANMAFPLSSPGIALDEITEASVEAADLLLYMVPVAAKLDVSVADGCDFQLDEVTLLNGARKAFMRSTVIDDDGTSVSDLTMKLPTNYGGTVRYEAVVADGNTTESTPIYLYPNEGDSPATIEADKIYEGSDEDLTLSDPTNGYNPTYLLVKGRAAGFGDVVGYYKIAVRYDPSTDSYYDDESVIVGTTYTYDIIRGNHYKVYLNKVDNAGYATEAEALAGPANNISYNITVDAPDDSRNEVVVSDNGLYTMELSASSVYVRGWSSTGIDLDLSAWFGKNTEVSSDYYTGQKVYISGSDGIEITSDKEISLMEFGAENVIDFTVTASGSITIRYGNLTKVIPVYHENTNISIAGGEVVTVNDIAVFAEGAALSGSVYDYINKSNSTTVDMFSEDGTLSAFSAEFTYSDITMDSFSGRVFDGYVYPTDMSGGKIRFLCNQGLQPFHLTYTLGEDPDTDVEYFVVGYEDFLHMAEATTLTWANNVTYKSFAGCTFRMLCDVDLQEGDPDREYIPIGYDQEMTCCTPFSGTFDGGNFEVSNMYVPIDGRYMEEMVAYDDFGEGGRGLLAGLFATIVNGATIKNVTVKGRLDDDDRYSYSAGVVGCTNQGTVTIKNCKNYVNIKGSDNVGGIIGSAFGSTGTCTIEDCYNYGTIEGTNSSYYGGVGGVAGYFSTDGTISNCDNNADVKGAQNVGGIAGYVAGDDSNDAIVENCTNSGSVVSEYTTTISGVLYVYQLARIGGVIGSASYVSLENCDNEGLLVSGNFYSVGGIVGYAASGSVSIANCDNKANISSSSNYIGGIVGSSASYLTIKSCTNDGNLEGDKTASTRIGGIIGSHSTYTATIDECDNNGDISGTQYLGGIFGWPGTTSSVTISNSNNNGNLSGTQYLGGVVGRINGTSSSTNTTSISNCLNTGEVSGTSNVGGVAGYSYYNVTIKECKNTNSVSGTQYVGGIVGRASYSSSYTLYIYDCVNLGYVYGTSTYVGGIIGRIYKTAMYNCYNRATVQGTTYLGGVAGGYGSGTIYNCYSAGEVTTSSSTSTLVGGALGSSSGTITDCFYLSGTGNNSLGTPMTDMKSDTFKETLSSNSTSSTYSSYSLSDWLRDDEENDGYPYLEWETTE